jgi:hypothetical protein
MSSRLVGSILARVVGLGDWFAVSAGVAGRADLGPQLLLGANGSTVWTARTLTNVDYDADETALVGGTWVQRSASPAALIGRRVLIPGPRRLRVSSAPCVEHL